MRKPFFKVAKALVVILLFTLPLTFAAQEKEWSDLIYFFCDAEVGACYAGFIICVDGYCTYWSVIGRCPESGCPPAGANSR